MDQQELWIDTIEDALQASVVAAGGPKKVANALWPAKTVTDAARLLSHCLAPDRLEKLALVELVMVMRLGKEAGAHTVMHYLAQELGYEQPRPVEPEDEKARLQREYIEAVQQLQKLSSQIEHVSKLQEVSK